MDDRRRRGGHRGAVGGAEQHRGLPEHGAGFADARNDRTLAGDLERPGRDDEQRLLFLAFVHEHVADLQLPDRQAATRLEERIHGW